MSNEVQPYNDANLEIVANVGVGVARMVDNLAAGKTQKVEFDLGGYSMVVQTKRKRAARKAPAAKKKVTGRGRKKAAKKPAKRGKRK